MLHNLFIKLITQTSALFTQTLPTFPTSNYHKHCLTSSVLAYPFVQHQDTSIQWRFAMITNNFADVYAYKNIFLLKATTIALRPTIIKRRNGHLTEEINLLTIVNRARSYYDNFVSSISHDARSNISTNQQTALIDPSSNSDIVIKEAYKGGAITIINKDDLIDDCNTLLLLLLLAAVVVSSHHQSPRCGAWRVEKVLAADIVGR